MLTKVLVIHNSYQHFGGEDAAVQAQLQLLRSRGHEVILYSKQSSSIRDYSLRAQAIFFPTTVFNWNAYREIKALVRREKPDIAHVHNVFPLISPSAYMALQHSGIPIVQTLHNYRFLCPNAFFFTQGRVCELCKFGNTSHAVRLRCFHDSALLSGLYALTLALHRRIDTFRAISQFIALTQFTADQLVEGKVTSSDKVTVLGNPLPEPLPAAGAPNRRDGSIVYMGRLSEEKGVWTLLEAFRRQPEMRLIVMGDGPLAEPMRSYIREQGMRNVRMAGFVTGEAKWEMLRLAAACVVPSVCYECFPLSALESFAVGTPVIASRLGSLQHVVKDRENGYLFDPGDAADLGDKIARLLSNPDESATMGQAGHSMALQQYTASAHYEQLMRIYRTARHGQAHP